MVSDRNQTLDSMKGLGIILMVLGHCAFPFTHFVYLFHMAVFFMLSGYFFKSNDSDDWSSLLVFIMKRIKRLYVPYMITNVCFILLHNVFIDINIYTNSTELLSLVPSTQNIIMSKLDASEMFVNIVKALLLHSNSQLGGATWFFSTLLELQILYGLIDLLIKKVFKIQNTRITQTGISVVFSLAGWLCSLRHIDLFGLQLVFSCYILFHCGYLLKNLKIYRGDRNIQIYYHLILTALSIGILLVLSNLGGVDLASNSYQNPIFLMVVSLAGWQLVYFISEQLIRIKVCRDFLVCCGQNTIAVVSLNFLCFKIVNAIGVYINEEPHFLIAAFPVLYRDGLYWVAYAVVGLVVPVVISVNWKKVKKSLRMLPKHKIS